MYTVICLWAKGYSVRTFNQEKDANDWARAAESTIGARYIALYSRDGDLLKGTNFIR